MSSKIKTWGFKKDNGELTEASLTTIRGYINMLQENLNKDDVRAVIPLSHGDPSAFPCFRTTSVAEDAVAQAVRSANFNGYSPTVGIPPARIAIAEYLSKDLPEKLSPDDIYLTVGCTQAIEVILTVLARPNANILLPRPGFPYYEARAAFSHLEVRHFDLCPERGWEVDLHEVEALADENTVAIVVINPGNPCGNVYTYDHLKKVAEAARKLGILVIADEVYDHLVYGSNPFVPMGIFGSITPIITLGSISKRWLVPGWRLGWLVTNDPNGILKEYGVHSLTISLHIQFIQNINVLHRKTLFLNALLLCCIQFYLGCELNKPCVASNPISITLYSDTIWKIMYPNFFRVSSHKFGILIAFRN